VRWNGYFISLLLFAGCTHSTIKPIPIVGILKPGASIIEEAQAWSGSLRSLRLLGRLAIDTDDGHFTSRLAVVYRAPEMLRVEVLPLNSTVSLGLLLSNGESATYVDFQGQRAIRGSLKSLLGYSLLAVSANEPELLSLLSGRIFKGALTGSGVRVYHNPVAGTYQLVSGRSTWVVNERTKFLHSAQLLSEEGGDVQLDVRYVEDATGKKALMSIAGRDERLEFSLDREKLDTEVPQSLFSINIPESFTVY
jgi:outer membrane lipoprotein-sorting protein